MKNVRRFDMKEDFKAIAESVEEAAKKYGLDYVSCDLVNGAVSIVGIAINDKKVDLFKANGEKEYTNMLEVYTSGN